jgi:hypothetical protein
MSLSGGYAKGAVAAKFHKKCTNLIYCRYNICVANASTKLGVLRRRVDIRYTLDVSSR